MAEPGTGSEQVVGIGTTRVRTVRKGGASYGTSNVFPLRRAPLGYQGFRSGGVRLNSTTTERWLSWSRNDGFQVGAGDAQLLVAVDCTSVSGWSRLPSI